jgi:hypothetical protein
MFVYLKPIILVFIPDQGRHKILSIKENELDLPYIELENNSSISENLNLVLQRSLTNNIVSLNKAKLADIEVLDNNLYIYYIVFVNYETSIKYGHLISVDLNNVKLSSSIKEILSLLI